MLPPLRHYCVLLLLVLWPLMLLLPISLLSKTILSHLFACKTNKIVAEVPQSIENNHACLVSQRFKPERSVQIKNVFLAYGSTRITCRNTLLNDSDDRRFVSQTCFHCHKGVTPRGMTPLEISYACPEIKGNHNRNHWKSGNQASRQKSQFVTKFFLKYM